MSHDIRKFNDTDIDEWIKTGKKIASDEIIIRYDAFITKEESPNATPIPRHIFGNQLIRYEGMKFVLQSSRLLSDEGGEQDKSTAEQIKTESDDIILKIKRDILNALDGIALDYNLRHVPYQAKKSIYDRRDQLKKDENKAHRGGDKKGRPSDWTTKDLTLAVTKAVKAVSHLRTPTLKNVAEIINARYSTKPKLTADSLKVKLYRHKINWKLIKGAK